MAPSKSTECRKTATPSELLPRRPAANPVGTHGALRTGVQIMAPRFREDLTLDAGEVIEAAEGVVLPIDPSW